MILRVAVLAKDGMPLMPTKPSRARRWVREGKAIGKWNDLGIYYVQLVHESGSQTQPVVCGIDPGKSYSGFGVQSSGVTLFRGHVVLPFQRVKERMGAAVIKNGKIIKPVRGRALQRRGRRGRRINRQIPFSLRCHRQKRFDNRKRVIRNDQNEKESRVQPSIKASRLMEIRVAKELCSIFPIQEIVYEVVKADVDLTSGRKSAKSGKGFSPVMAGQYWCIKRLSRLAPVKKMHGWQKDGNGTSQIRKYLGL